MSTGAQQNDIAERCDEPDVDEFAAANVFHLMSDANSHATMGHWNEAGWRLLDAAGLCYDLAKDAKQERAVGLNEFTGRGYRLQRRADCAIDGCMGLADPERGYSLLCVPCAEDIELPPIFNAAEECGFFNLERQATS